MEHTLDGQHLNELEALRLARSFMQYLTQGRRTEALQLTAPNFIWHIAGDVAALPWVGKFGEEGLIAFTENYQKLIEPLAFDAYQTFYQSGKVITLGHLVSKVKLSGRVIDSDFVSLVEIEAGLISRYQLFEDSFAVSEAVR